MLYPHNAALYDYKETRGISKLIWSDFQNILLIKKLICSHIHVKVKVIEENRDLSAHWYQNNCRKLKRLVNYKKVGVKQ